MPLSALKRSPAGTPGRVSRKGLKLWENGGSSASTTLLSRLPPTSKRPTEAGAT